MLQTSVCRRCQKKATAEFHFVSVAIMKLYYHRDLSMLAGMTLLITTQCLGFGLAGMVSDILIKPTSMYWPAVLVQVQLFQALHGKGNKSKINQRRFRLFMIITTCCFVYQVSRLWTFSLSELTELSAIVLAYCILHNSDVHRDAVPRQQSVLASPQSRQRLRRRGLARLLARLVGRGRDCALGHAVLGTAERLWRTVWNDVGCGPVDAALQLLVGAVTSNQDFG